MTLTPWRIIIPATGGPEVLQREAFTPRQPGPGELLVRNTAIGVNFIDIYFRTGLYPQRLPGGIGREAAGVVEAVGPDVTGFAVGDRVAWLGADGYATHATVKAASTFPLNDAMSDEDAAALLLKGLTAWMLAEGVRPVKPGMNVLIYAASGGVGSLLVPWVKSLGGFVIAHTGTPEKAERAHAAGADVALSCPLSELAENVRAATDGHGADLILDSVGKDSWPASLKAVARLGLIATYGNASGPVPPFAPLELTNAGSAYVTRPTMFDWIADPENRKIAWNRLQQLVAKGTISANIHQRFKLSEAAEAHRQLESRQTTGATILIPD